MARWEGVEEVVSVRSLVARPRLLARLDERWEAPVVVLQAAAGFGKSSLLRQALTQNLVAARGVDRLVACEHGDHDWGLLARGIAQALEIETGLPEADLPAASGALRSAFARWSPTPFCLVLDDVHEVPSDSAGAALLAVLVEALPSNGHLVLAGRNEPAVALARATAAGRCRWVPQEELAFDDDELAAFAAARHVPAERLQSAGRWPALLEMAASVAAVGDGPARPTGREFIWEEVLRGLPDEDVTALAVLALVRGGDQEVLDGGLRAIGRPPVPLSRILHLPLVTMAGGWATVHGLWGDHVAHVLEPEAQAAVRSAVAADLADRKHYEAAFDLHCEGGEKDAMLGVVRSATRASAPPLPAVTCRRWLDAMPSALRTTPEAELLGGIVAKSTDRDPSRAQSMLLAAAAGFRSSGDVDAELASMVHVMQVLMWTGDRDAQIALLGRVFELEGTGHPVATALAVLGRAFVRRFGGDLLGARDELRTLDRASLDRSWTALTDCQLAEIEMSLGRPAEALDIIEAARPHLGTEFHDAADTVAGHCLWRLGRWDEFDESARRQLERAERAGRREPLDAARAGIALAAAARGRMAEARALIDLVEMDDTYSNVSARVAGVRAAILTDAGDETAAAAVLADDHERFPLTDGRWAQRAVIAPLQYVLLPDVRRAWDEAPAEPALAAALDLARAFVALREGDLSSAARIDAGPRQLMAALGGPWAAELAVAGVATRSRADADVVAIAEHQPSWLQRLTKHPVDALALCAARLAEEVPVPPERTVTVRLLGEVSVEVDGSAPERIRRARVKQLLVLLALRGRTDREQVMATLWPDLAHAAAANNLRVTLAHLRSSLEPDREAGAASFMVRQRDGSLDLAPEPWLTLDVRRLEAAADSGFGADRAGRADDAVAAFREVVRWYGGPLDPGGDHPWAPGASQRIRDLFTSSALRAGEVLVAQGDHEGAAELARRALDEEPYSERAFRLLATAQLAAGQRTAARRTIDRCLRTLEQLGVGAEPATMMIDRNV